MALVTVAAYQDATGDTTTATATVATALTDAQRLLEEYLGRPLEKATRTERVRIFTEQRGQVAYPQVTPLVSVSAPSGAEISGAAVLGATPASSPSFLADRPAYGEVTYVGGFDPAEDDLAAVTYVPRTLLRAIARAAYGLLHPPATTAPVGAQSVQVGDVSVSFGPGGATADEVSWPASVRRWRARRDLAA